MIRIAFLFVLSLAVSLCLATGSLHAEETQTTGDEQAQQSPQMPPGHPPVSGGQQETPQGQPEMPQGHPPVKRFHGQMPAGHPPVTKAPEVVYETTEVEPEWFVAVRHLIVRPMEDQMHVTEVWAVVNPTEKSYIGKPVEVPSADKAGDSVVANETGNLEQPAKGDQAEQKTLERITITMPIPQHASHVQPGRGFAPDNVLVEDGKLVSGMPLIPGTNELHINYLLAPVNGVFKLPLTVDAPIKQMMVFLPDDESKVEAVGLTAGEPFKAGNKQFRMFMGKELEKGTPISVTIEVEPAGEEQSSSATPALINPASGQSGQMKMIAGIGGGAVALAALVVMMKPSRKPEPTGAAG